MRLYQNKLGKYVVLDDNGKIVIITHHKKIAEAYAKKQSQKFLEGKSPPDFAAEDYEVSYKNRATFDDLTHLGKKQLAL